jgi:hypothetical protein
VAGFCCRKSVNLAVKRGPVDLQFDGTGQKGGFSHDVDRDIALTLPLEAAG